jgi:disulfide bond formation protein DsbB
VVLPLLAAVVALAGSLWLSLGMGFTACPLCIYQRTFVMGVVAVLGVGLFTEARFRPVLNLLALPLAVAGFVVAILQLTAELLGKIECPTGILGIGTAPQQSVVALGIVLVLVVGACMRTDWSVGCRWPVLAWSGVLGLLLAVAGLLSAPPLPSPPTKPYERPPDACRAPYLPP